MDRQKHSNSRIKHRRKDVLRVLKIHKLITSSSQRECSLTAHRQSRLHNQMIIPTLQVKQRSSSGIILKLLFPSELGLNRPRKVLKLLTSRSNLTSTLLVKHKPPCFNHGNVITIHSRPLRRRLNKRQCRHRSRCQRPRLPGRNNPHVQKRGKSSSHHGPINNHVPFGLIPSGDKLIANNVLLERTSAHRSKDIPPSGGLNRPRTNRRSPITSQNQEPLRFHGSHYGRLRRPCRHLPLLGLPPPHSGSPSSVRPPPLASKLSPPKRHSQQQK